MHGLNPHLINNNILMACENHDINIRFANNMNVVVPKPNVETFRNSFIYQGAISWNIVLLSNRTTYNSLAELCPISCINMFK